MKICSIRHEEVSYNSNHCPVCQVREENKNIPISHILEDIENSLKNLEHWYKDRLASNVVSTERHLDIMLRLCEEFMVGQVGGFDFCQQDRTLKGRYDWLRKMEKE